MMHRWYFLLVCYLLLFLFPLQSASLSEETVYLTWQKSPSTTMTIQWISPTERKETIIYYRERKKEKNWEEARGIAHPFPKMEQYLLHSVQLEGLLPSTQYSFKLGLESPENQFLTAPATLSKEIQFVVGGDLYHDDSETLIKTCSEAASKNPLFALLGGDIAYAVTSRFFAFEDTERWLEWIKIWHETMITPEGNRIPTLSAIGNHDLVKQYQQTPEQAKVFSALFPMPGAQIYNVLDFNDFLSIWILDSGHAHPISGDQSKWLKNTLQNRAQVSHKIAIYHVPAYPSVRSFNNEISKAIRQFWVPLFEQFGIQTVFENHDHTYKRTYCLLKNRIDPRGVLYIGDGCWGISRARKLPLLKRFYIEKHSSLRHFILVTLFPEAQLIQCIHEGQVVDQCLKKNPPNES